MNRQIFRLYMFILTDKARDRRGFWCCTNWTGYNLFIAMSVNPVRRKYSRHIDIRRHYIRELCLGNLVKVVPLSTNLMVSDCRRSETTSFFLLTLVCSKVRLFTDYFPRGRATISMMITISMCSGHFVHVKTWLYGLRTPYMYSSPCTPRHFPRETRRKFWK